MSYVEAIMARENRNIPMANQNRSRNRSSSSSSAVTENDEFDMFEGGRELMISVSGQKPVASVYTLVCCSCCDAKVKSISCAGVGEGRGG